MLNPIKRTGKSKKVSTQAECPVAGSIHYDLPPFILEVLETTRKATHRKNITQGKDVTKTTKPRTLLSDLDELNLKTSELVEDTMDITEEELLATIRRNEEDSKDKAVLTDEIYPENCESEGTISDEYVEVQEIDSSTEIDTAYLEKEDCDFVCSQETLQPQNETQLNTEACEDSFYGPPAPIESTTDEAEVEKSIEFSFGRKPSRRRRRERRSLLSIFGLGTKQKMSVDDSSIAVGVPEDIDTDAVVPESCTVSEEEVVDDLDISLADEFLIAESSEVADITTDTEGEVDPLDVSLDVEFLQEKNSKDIIDKEQKEDTRPDGILDGSAHIDGGDDKKSSITITRLGGM